MHQMHFAIGLFIFHSVSQTSCISAQNMDTIQGLIEVRRIKKEVEVSERWEKEKAGGQGKEGD